MAAEVVVHTAVVLEPPAMVGQAFQQFRSSGSPHGVLVLPPAMKPERVLVELIAGELQKTPGLKALSLVHPSPLIGFITSSLCLRVPTVNIRAFASEGQAVGGRVA